MSIRIVILFLLGIGLAGTAFSQTDSTSSAEAAGSSVAVPVYRDSAALSRWYERREEMRRQRDSIRAVQDSLKMAFLKVPDPNRPNRFLDSIISLYEVKNLDFKEWGERFPELINQHGRGEPRPKGQLWVVVFIIFLLLFFAILKNKFSKELSDIMQAFYSNRVLGLINKEEDFFSTWPFVFLYLLFGFPIGMFLYQCFEYFRITFNYSGFEWFLRLSLGFLAIYTAKIILIRILGFLFDEKRIAKEYIAILLLSYINTALLFLPLVVAFSLTPLRFASYYIYISLFIIAITYILQCLRAIVNILSNHRFTKVYLIIYLCALEICPLLIVMKVLRF